jgi:hypothetical protein
MLTKDFNEYTEQEMDLILEDEENCVDPEYDAVWHKFLASLVEDASNENK